MASAIAGDPMFEVSNQPPPLEPYNLFASDAVLREAVKREGAGWGEAGLNALGATLGKPETIQLGFDANKYPPILRTLRPLRPSPRRGRFPSGLARAADDRARAPACIRPLGRSEARRACGARGRLLHAQPDRERRLLPARHDLRLGADACGTRRRSPRNGCRRFSRRATTGASSRSAKRPAR